MQELTGVWRAISNEFASVVEKASSPVVAVHGRRRIPSSGVHWKPGIIVAAEHSLERDEEVTITLAGGTSIAAEVAGRDPSTDVAILKVGTHPATNDPGNAKSGAQAEGKAEVGKLSLPEFADPSRLKVGHWVLAAARTSEGSPRASFALLGVVGPAWRSWRGGVLDLTLRLDRRLHPNFSGAPVVTSDGGVLGIATSGLSRYGAVVIPATTVDRVAAELEKKGHIGRGFLGIGLAPVRIPRRLRESLQITQETGMLVMAVEAESPADKAGVVLGDLLVALDGNPVRDTDDVQGSLAAERIGKPVEASMIRGGAATDIVITVGEHPIRR